jgi:adenylylsulfate kinase-like enzyme
MKNNKFVVYILGTSCAGKSTVEDLLKKEIPGMYTLNYDKTKWQFSDYHRDTHKDRVKSLIKDFFEATCRAGHSILLITLIEDRGEYKSFVDIAVENNYKFLPVQLTAPKDILLKRFRERIKSAKKAGSKISVTDENLFLKNMSRKFFVPDNTSKFDSSKQSPEDIVGEILKLLN